MSEQNARGTIKGVIFDMDGVILDSMWIWDELGARYVKEQGIVPEDNLRDVLFTMSLEEGAKYIKNQYNIPGTAQEVLGGILGLIEHFYLEEVQAKPGAREIMEYFNARDIPMIVATSSDRNQIAGALKRLGLLGFVKDILTCNQLETSKRSPFIYQKAAEKIGTMPEETLVLEDSLFALETAKNAGFLCGGVYDKASEKDQEQLREKSDWYCRDLSELQIMLAEK